MALFLSTLASNRFTKPPVKANPGPMGQARNVGTSFSLGTTHDTGDVILLFAIPTNFVMRTLRLSTDGAATAGAGDFGLYTLNDAGDTETAVDIDLFASAQAITTALERSDIIDEAGNVGIANRFQQIWEVAGLSADPGGVFWVGMTITTDVDATNVIGLETEGLQ